jgi:hypothetical protein
VEETRVPVGTRGPSNLNDSLASSFFRCFPPFPTPSNVADRNILPQLHPLHTLKQLHRLRPINFSKMSQDMDMPLQSQPQIQSNSNPTPAPTDNYTWDPASSPRGNHLAKLGALGVFCVFASMGLFYFIVCIARRVRHASNIRDKRKPRTQAHANATALWPKTPSSDSASSMEKGTPLMTPTADEAFEQEDPCSPAAAAAARSRLRVRNESSTSVNNFSRPRAAVRAVVQHVALRNDSSPALELENVPGEPLSSPALYNALHRNSLNPYSYSRTIHT